MRYVLIGAASVLVCACGGPQEVSLEIPVRPAKLIEVSTTNGVRTLRLPAVVGAASTSDLAFQVSGQLLELGISEGDRVTRGQALATLDQRDFLNDVASARAQYDNAQIEFERAERLLNENAIAQSVLDERISQRDTTLAALRSAEKALSDSVVRAPFDGIVADIYFESFENVSAQQSILTLQSEGDAEAIVQVPASVVANIENVQPIDIKIELDASPGTVMPAEFSEASSIAEANTQTFETRFTFSPTSNLVVLPGMTGILTGRFETQTSDGEELELVTLPLTSIVSEAGDTFVWLVNSETMTVSRRNVKVEPGPGGSVLVTEGLQGGETIVGAGGKYLNEGMQIREYES